MKQLAATLLWMALTTGVFAQAPPLALRVVLGQQEVELRNYYTARATAWAVQYEPASDAHDGAGTLLEWHDYTLDPGAPLKGIAAGDAVRWKPTGGLGGRLAGTGFRIVAVLYEDGSSFGGAGLVRGLLEVRQFAYDDAAEDVRLLENFQQQPRAGFDALVRQFEARVAQHSRDPRFRAPEGVTPIPGPDPVCSAILATLRLATTLGRDTISRIEAAKIEALFYYDLFTGSKPALQAVANAPVWQTAGPPASGSITRMDAAWRVVAGANAGETRLRNTYEAPATAWVVETSYTKGQPSERQYIDQMLAEHGHPLPPNEAHYAGMRVSPERPPREVEVVAVVYEDGATAGQQRYIDALLGRRRVILSSISTVLEAFMGAEAKQGVSAADVKRTLEACAARIQSYADQAKIHETDSLCSPAARELQTGRPLDQVISRYGPVLEAVYQRLKSAKPDPQQSRTQAQR